MGKKCCAYGCRSGYYSQNDSLDIDSHNKITFHKFPLENKELTEAWVKANPRQGIVPSKYSVLCSKHFRLEDFRSVSSDTNVTRKRKAESTNKEVLRRYLNPDAVPSIFPNAPSYLSKPPTAPRSSTMAEAGKRLHCEHIRLQSLQDSFSENDSIIGLTLTDIVQKLEDQILPNGFTTTVTDDKLFCYMLCFSSVIPSVACCVTVREDRSFTCSMGTDVLPNKEYKDLAGNSIETITQLLNIMARIKSLLLCEKELSVEGLITMAQDKITSCLECLADSESMHKFLSFIQEQLILVLKSKYSRSYSSELLVFSYILHATSPAAYRLVRDEGVLCLPSVATLDKITRRVDSKKGLDTSAYLKMRFSKLNKYEKCSILLIDEIYVAKRIEYSGGKMIGLTEDGEVASTLLCFMIKSLASKYKDIVAMYPVAKLTAVKQYKYFNDIMLELNTIGFNVVAVSVDNATANRKFFVDCLCDGTLKTSVINAATGQPLFLLFDPVHCIKNVYNNFQAKKQFLCPPMGNNIPSEITASFKHVSDLYNLESSMSLKKAHTLKFSALHPRSIEKTSVKLAVSVFCESTRNALNYYASTDSSKQDWQETALFISVVMKLWNILNVKTCTKGKHKRDNTMDPVTSSHDWKLEFLREFAQFLKIWEVSKKPGLTRETFLALRHTCNAIVDCVTHLISNCDFRFVLIGHLQSDAIESRFGWFRQLSGANYMVSMKQIVDSDRIIKAVSLLKFSCFTIDDLDMAIDTISKNENDDGKINVVANEILSQLKLDKTPTTSDCHTIYYVAGAIGRSVVRSLKCEHCRNELVSKGPTEHIPNYEPCPSEYLDSVTRGGLSHPTEYCYMTAVSCWTIFDEIKSRDDVLLKFVKFDSHRELFSKIVKLAAVHISALIDGNCCCNNHDLLHHVCQRFFNCVAKNFAKFQTINANVKCDAVSTGFKRNKIAKLNSMA